MNIDVTRRIIIFKEDGDGYLVSVGIRGHEIQTDFGKYGLVAENIPLMWIKKEKLDEMIVMFNGTLGANDALEVRYL